MIDNTELITIINKITGSFIDKGGNEYMAVYPIDWDEIIQAVRDYDKLNRYEKGRDG